MSVASGIVKKIIFKSKDSDFFIFTMESWKKSFTAKGFASEIRPGDFLELEGQWEKYKGEDSLKCSKIKLKLPVTRESLLKFLSSGRIPGVGIGTASKLIDHYGMDLILKISEDPESVLHIKGIRKSTAQRIASKIVKIAAESSIDIFLQELDISKSLQNRLKKEFGVSLIETIEKNPYVISERLKGVGFKTSDAIAVKMGFDLKSDSRVQAGVLHSLDERIFTTGDTIVSSSDLVEDSKKLLSLTESSLIEKNIFDLELSLKINSSNINNGLYYSPSIISKAEQSVAKHILRLSRKSACFQVSHETISSVQKRMSISLAPGQVQALKNSSSENFSVITGGPGTGKTTILNALIKIVTQDLNLNKEDVLLCSPTGKAAQRMSESTGLTAMTIHRALKYDPESNSFFYNSGNRLPHKVIVVDESSMMDVLISYWLFQAIKDGTKVLLVGDVDQLPSVGPGQVLKDIIESGKVKVSFLTDIFRQDEGSKIVENAHRINRGEFPIIDHSHPNNDFWMISRNSDSAINSEIVSLIDRLGNHYGLDKFDDIQVLTPMRKGMAGQHALNFSIQNMLNPPSDSSLSMKQEDQDFKYSANDKIIQVKNNNEIGIFNGNTGIIDKITSKKDNINVTFGTIETSYSLSEMADVRLAYAMTIHKSQGSEFPLVIIPVSMSHANMLNRNLLYTAVTRAKSIVVLVGQEKALRLAVNNIFNKKRTTGLKELLVKG